MEICVAMIAACAHALKPLFRFALKDSTIGQYRAYHSRSRSTQGTKILDGYDLQNIVKQSPSNASRRDREDSPGSISQVSMVPCAGAFSLSDPDGITKTTDLTVTVSSKSQTGETDETDEYGKSWYSHC